MLSIIKKILGLGPKTNYRALLEQGAQIIDVRTESEYQSGHIRGSVNVPLQELQQNFSKINREKPVITCCASGMRSASAKSLLQASGYQEVYNGGGWMGLQHEIEKP